MSGNVAEGEGCASWQVACYARTTCPFEGCACARSQAPLPAASPWPPQGQQSPVQGHRTHDFWYTDPPPFTAKGAQPSRALEPVVGQVQ